MTKYPELTGHVLDKVIGGGRNIECKFLLKGILRCYLSFYFHGIDVWPNCHTVLYSVQGKKQIRTHTAAITTSQRRVVGPNFVKMMVQSEYRKVQKQNPQCATCQRRLVQSAA